MRMSRRPRSARAEIADCRDMLYSSLRPRRLAYPRPSIPSCNQTVPEELPLGLRNALESGRCVLFLGAGVGKCARNADGRPAPTGQELANELKEAFAIPGDGDLPLSKAAQYVEISKGRKELLAFIMTRLAGLEPDDSVRWISSIRWKAIFTTNYDSIIERAYDLDPEPAQKHVSTWSSSSLKSLDPRFDVPVIHLHGWAFAPDGPTALITDDDYATYRKRRGMLFDLIKSEFATSPLLYMGYSNEDQNWRMVLSEVTEEFLPSHLPEAFRVTPSTDPVDRAILGRKRITCIDATIEEFVALCRNDLEGQGTSEYPGEHDASIPGDLSNSYEENPAPTLRLLNHWEYVNGADFSATPNTHEFLRGDLPNWSLIGTHGAFARDIEEQVYDRLLEYATSSTRKRDTVLLSGHAGSGVSTALMNLACRLVRERAGPVFMLKRGRPLTEGDVEFAASIAETRPFFVIDNGVDYSDAIVRSLQRLKQARLPACFLIGERRNEWLAGHTSLKVAEYGISGLSDSEVDRLLDCLQTHEALNKLAPLDRSMQRSLVRRRFNNVLLVAMREATEGQSFDAIIEDEYRNLADDYCRRLYSVVSCAFQVRIPMRNALLAKIVERDQANLFEGARESTDGVIIEECIDDARQIYASRARHPVISQIVWNRCLSGAEREQLALATVEALNLVYHQDGLLFDALVQSDEQVDSIATLEGRINFFESACKKEPDHAFVRQHYARMLLRSNKLEAALSQADQALRIMPDSHILLHTRGTVLGRMVVDAPSVEIARKRLVQSESNFKQAINLRKKDAYSYDGLARLYLNWAKKCGDSEQEVEYLAKAERVLGDGLRTVKNRAPLWIVSAKVKERLGDSPGAISRLDQAMRAGSLEPYSAYLLARSYSGAGQHQKAADTLQPAIESAPDDYRLLMEYGRALACLHEPYSKIIAVLEQGKTIGSRDPRYLAFLGGVLFMNGDFSRADEVFREYRRREFSWEEQNRISFRPCAHDTTEPMKMDGSVAKVGAGYTFLRSKGFPDFYYAGTTSSGSLLAEGGLVVFELAFCSRGPKATNVHPK
jgi:tetratricopeptide (TPR) repeat protein